jgi:predicted aspartyl protease
LYTLQTQLNIKGFTFHTRALGDTGANGFLFINSELAALLTRYCGARSKPLSYAILVTGYNGNGNSRITYYIRLTLQIDNRRFVRILFCIALLRKYNVIIGHKWFKYFKINLAVADRKLFWP